MHLLPITDLTTIDETCIYSTLKYIENQTPQLIVETPCITFDQPLWILMVEIVLEKKINIVCRLGGYHMLMSFICRIGRIMDGSSLQEECHVNYTSALAIHMLSGKAYARELRGYFLTEAALINLLLK